MVLLYKAATEDGKIVRGLIEAKDIQEAALYLRKHKMLPITIAQQKENPLISLMSFNARFTGTDLVFFTRQIASMLTSGLSLIQSLTVLNNQIKKKAVSDVINKIITSIEEGSTFSKAISQYPRIFSPTYVSLVKAAESSGLLDKVMTGLAVTLEKQEALRSKVKSALLYPAIVLIMMAVVIFIMMLFVIPQLNTLYDSLSIELPATTRVLIFLSDLTVKFWPILLGITALSFYLFRRWRNTKPGRKQVDTVLLRLPLFGKILRFRILTEFSRTFGLLIGAGDPIVGSLTQAKDVTGNVIYEDAIAGIAKQVEAGVAIGDAFNASPVFPPHLVQMIRVGEQTGKLDESLSRAADYFEREVEQSVKTLTTAMEPFIMAVLGLGVAFLLVAVITPIYKLSSSF